MKQSSGVEAKVTVTNAEEESEARDSKPSPQVTTKKPYSKPICKVYGNIKALTTTVGCSTEIDGGSSGCMTRTH